MAVWPSEFNWAADVAETKYDDRKRGGFRASEDCFLPVIVDLYNGEALALAEQPSFESARDLVCQELVGRAMLRAQVYDHKCNVRFELDSRN